MRRFFFFALSSMLLWMCDLSFAQLTVRSDSYGSKPGFIDKATLVVEPHGAYVEQSLYLSYSDHFQFPSSQVEIVHRFELPANAVVNDMWLWIGDSVMQAVILDTWKARAIYDSIVNRKRDPAFLSKTGNTYELHIYPLASGSYRKVRLNFITPTRWLGTEGAAELPLKMLKANNALKKPLQVMFREAQPIWGTPTITELPLQTFTGMRDTSGYKFRYSNIDDISALSSFTMGFTTNFTDGFFITTKDAVNDGTYFQFGFNPGSLFNLQIDPSPRHLLFALDLSGVHCKNFVTLMPNVKQLMRSAARPNDSIQVVVAGAGKIETLNPVWTIAHTDSINTAIDRFASSEWGRQVALEKLPAVLYADAYAAICWQFPGLEQLASTKVYGDLSETLRNMQGADVIAAYTQGFENASSTSANYEMIVSKLDTFFTQGGRFLSYYDYNRVGREEICSHYIPGLTTTRRPDGSATLYRNPNGAVGRYFPESFVHYGFDYLQYTADPSVTIEVMDKDGRPVVISKKIGNGLIVVSGIWSFKDDGALRAQLGAPMLGLNEVKKNQQLTGLFAEIQSKYKRSPFQNVYVLSNSDSLFQKTDVFSWSAAYLGGFGSALPVVTTVNLLDGAGYLPASLTEDQIQYYGSGYLMKTIAAATKGRHIEMHIDNWTYLFSALNAYSYPTADSMTVSVSVDNGAGQLRELREVNPIPADANKARFYIGSASLANQIRFDVRARFAGQSNAKTASTSTFIFHDTSSAASVLPAMLGTEKLRDLFNQQNKDTASIVKLAVKYRLLCDFTALLALEPNDTIHYMKHPLDESVLGVARSIEPGMTDSLLLSSYPNPFNNQTTIVIELKRRSFVEAGIYNIIGQRVKTLASHDAVEGRKLYSWNGTDDRNRTVSSGAYFIRVAADDGIGKQSTVRLRRILFLK